MSTVYSSVKMRHWHLEAQTHKKGFGLTKKGKSVHQDTGDSSSRLRRCLRRISAVEWVQLQKQHSTLLQQAIMLWRGKNCSAGCLSHNDRWCSLLLAGWAAELARHTTAKDEVILLPACMLHKAEQQNRTTKTKLTKSYKRAGRSLIGQREFKPFL